MTKNHSQSKSSKHNSKVSHGNANSNSAKIITKKQQQSSLYFSNTDLTDLESQRCDVIDEFVMYEREMVRMENEIIPALANRSYHLPGNTYCEDIIQYYRNNHPIISIFCHHVQHPIKFRMRLLQLFGSIVCGLTLTNAIWLWFYFSGSDENEPVITIPISDGTSTEASDGTQEEFTVTQGMIYLWTIGGTIHAIYDNTIWYISACVCCLSSENLDTYRKWGTYFIVTTVLTFTAIATLALLLRTSVEEAQNDNDDGIVEVSFHDKYVFEFLISYATEFVLALCVYYPVVAYILFSGVLACGFNIPILGGRPYEVAMAEKAYNNKINNNLGSS